MLEIRQESKNDYDEVYTVVKEAFETAEHSDGNEHDLVDALRKSNSFIPELSLVAIEDSKIVGHILFTKIGKKSTLYKCFFSYWCAIEGSNLRPSD